MLIRKMVLAGVVSALAFAVVEALPVIDAAENQDWASFKTLGVALGLGVAGAFARGLFASLTAFVPSDADVGVNLVGKYK